MVAARVIVRYITRQGGTIWLFRACPDCFELVWEVPAGRGRLLADDADRHVILLSLDAAPSLQPLAPDTPPAPPETSRPETFEDLCEVGCRRRLPEEPRGPVGHLHPALQRRLVAPNPLRRDRAEALARVTGLVTSPWPLAQERTRTFLDIYLKHRPQDIDFQLLRASQAAWLNDWADLDRLMIPLPAPDRDDPHFRHYHHLRVLQALRTGRPADAAALAERALDAPGDCPLQALHEVARACAGLPCGAQPPALRSLAGWLRALRDADAALDRGNPDAVIDLLDLPAIRDRRQRQSIARLASAWLARPAADDWDRYRRDAALAAASTLGDTYMDELPIPKPDFWWSDARIAEVAREAGAVVRCHHPVG